MSERQPPAGQLRFRWLRTAEFRWTAQEPFIRHHADRLELMGNHVDWPLRDCLDNKDGALEHWRLSRPTVRELRCSDLPWFLDHKDLPVEPKSRSFRKLLSPLGGNYNEN
jgi:hypothetical protein